MWKKKTSFFTLEKKKSTMIITYKFEKTKSIMTEALAAF